MSSRWRSRTAILAIALILSVPTASQASHGGAGYLTEKPPMIRLEPGAPPGSGLRPIINSGEKIGNFMFEGIPDGIGLAPGTDGTVRAFVSHEQSHVPFRGQADFEDASISELSLDTETAAIHAASVPLGPEEGFIRFCSAFMAGPEQGFSDYTFFANEESNDVIPVPPGAVYGPDPAVAPERQAGYAVALNAETGEFDEVAIMGRHNHENTVFVPGGWDEIVALSGDDTFSAPSSQLYMYLGRDESDIWSDEGQLWAFRVTATDEGPVDPRDPFNGANDYGDIRPGDVWQGRFIRVPDHIARGDSAAPPQTALERWSNRNNVFQFIRIEDTTYDRNDPLVHYLADTGEKRAIPDPETGRLTRGPSSTVGPYPNGRIFKMVFDPEDPRVVREFSILLDSDHAGLGDPSVMHHPDNMDASRLSLMVQEDSSQPPNSRIWRYDLATETWTVVASVRDEDWESSGIVDASEWFGPGSWLLDVQAHDRFVNSVVRDGILYKREAGQLLVMRLPGT